MGNYPSLAEQPLQPDTPSPYYCEVSAAKLLASASVVCSHVFSADLKLRLCLTQPTQTKEQLMQEILCIQMKKDWEVLHCFQQ